MLTQDPNCYSDLGLLSAVKTGCVVMDTHQSLQDQLWFKIRPLVNKMFLKLAYLE